MSKSAKESCGSPQGTVSSPWLFLIYMEALLRKISPVAEMTNVNLGMFSDDLTLWTTGLSLPSLEHKLTGMIKSVCRWNKSHNMQLAEKIGKCKTILFTNNRCDRAPIVLLYGKPLQSVKQTKLLGVVLDAQLTMKAHFQKLMKEGKRRIGQLCAVANCCFGPSQLSLRNMYVAYVRAVFDYASPVWFPLMSKTNLDKLQCLQNKALRVALGVPLSTRVHDLHLEANVTPLIARYEAATAYQAEKYRRHPPDDPLYKLAHANPPTRLKRKTWQHYSEEILQRVGIDPSREPLSVNVSSSRASHATSNPTISSTAPLHFVNDNNRNFHPFNNEDHTPISLHNRQPLRFTSRIPPWTIFSEQIKIVSDIPMPSKASPSQKRQSALQALEALGSFDLKLYTDGSVSDSGGGSACISYNPPVANPYKRRRLEYATPICIVKPEGRICFPSDAEFGGLTSAFDYILANKDTLNNSRVFIGTDCQSILKALDVGPHRRYHYLGVDTSPLWDKMYWIMDFCSELVLHYIPAHVCIIGNELADQYAKAAVARFTTQQQDEVCASLSNLKLYLNEQLMEDWNEHKSEQLRPGFRQSLLEDKTSHLKLRVASPRPFQSLFSRYRCNRVETAGEYAQKLEYTSGLTCRLCGAHRETISHLLNDCLGTRPICTKLRLSTLTLCDESPTSLRKVASFDSWLREHLQYTKRPPANRIQATLKLLEEEDKKKRKRKEDDTEQPSSKQAKREESGLPRSKRNCLVIPDGSLNDTIRTKIRRIS